MNASPSDLTIPDGYSLFAADLDHVCDIAGDALGDLKGSRILITGGSGFFGMWLVESLLYANERRDLGLEVTVLTRDADRYRSSRAPHLAGRGDLHVLEGTLTDFETGDRTFTHIIHAASESNVEARSDWAERHIEAALGGMDRVVDLAVRSGSQAVLITTSGAVYHNPERVVDSRFVEGPARQCDLTSERAVYGEAKRMMEVAAAVAAERHGFRVPIARCFAFVGPYLPLEANYAIGNFIRDALADQDIVISGDGTPLRSYLYAADLAAWLIVMLAKAESGRPVNVGGAEAYSIRALAEAVNGVAGASGRVIVKQEADPNATPNAYLPDVSRAKADLGLKPAIGLEDALLRTLAWHRAKKHA